MKKAIKQLIINTIFKLRYGKKLVIQKNVTVAKGSAFFGQNKLYENVFFSGEMHGGSYIGPNSTVYGQIGKYCSIGPNVSVLPGTHPMHFVSTSPVLYSKSNQAGYSLTSKQYFEELQFADENNKYSVIIGNDVWIGSNAIIVGGNKIGDGSVILANATVTKDVPPYAVVGGVPAKVLKYRFTEEQIDSLLRIKWWEKEEEWIGNNLELFLDIEEFLRKN